LGGCGDEYSCDDGEGVPDFFREGQDEDWVVEEDYECVDFYDGVLGVSFLDHPGGWDGVEYEYDPEEDWVAWGYLACGEHEGEDDEEGDGEGHSALDVLFLFGAASEDYAPGEGDCAEEYCC